MAYIKESWVWDARKDARLLSSVLENYNDALDKANASLALNRAKLFLEQAEIMVRELEKTVND